MRHRCLYYANERSERKQQSEQSTVSAIRDKNQVVCRVARTAGLVPTYASATKQTCTHPTPMGLSAAADHVAVGKGPCPPAGTLLSKELATNDCASPTTTMHHNGRTASPKRAHVASSLRPSSCLLTIHTTRTPNNRSHLELPSHLNPSSQHQAASPTKSQSTCKIGPQAQFKYQAASTQ